MDEGHSNHRERDGAAAVSRALLGLAMMTSLGLAAMVFLLQWQFGRALKEEGLEAAGPGAFLLETSPWTLLACAVAVVAFLWAKEHVIRHRAVTACINALVLLAVAGVIALFFLAFYSHVFAALGEFDKPR